MRHRILVQALFVAALIIAEWSGRLRNAHALEPAHESQLEVCRDMSAIRRKITLATCSVSNWTSKQSCTTGATIHTSGRPSCRYSRDRGLMKDLAGTNVGAVVNAWGDRAANQKG